MGPSLSANLLGRQGLGGPRQSQDEQEPREAAQLHRAKGFPGGRKAMCMTVEDAPARNIWVSIPDPPLPKCGVSRSLLLSEPPLPHPYHGDYNTLPRVVVGI